MGLLLKPFTAILINGFTLFLLTKFVDGATYTGGLKFFVLGGIIVGIINFFVKPILKILTLPVIALSGGLFLVVINVGVLWFLSYFFRVAQFQDVSLAFSNFESYVIGAIVFGLINWALHIID